MALTRRTARFGELAGQVESHLAGWGHAVGPEVVDAAVNHQCAHVAALLGVSPRSALAHATDHSALAVAEALAALVSGEELAAPAVGAGSRGTGQGGPA